MNKRVIGRTNIAVTAQGLGGTGLGNMYAAVADGDALATVNAAWDRGVRYFDTAPGYGFGLSEQRLGRALNDRPRDEFVLSTKVGYLFESAPRSARADDPMAATIWADVPAVRPAYDFSRDATLRSLEGSLQRLDVDRIDIVLIHDPDEAAGVQPGAGLGDHSHFAEVMDGAYPALTELRNQSVIGAVGVGITQWQMLCDFARSGDFDCFLLAKGYSLLDQSAHDELLPLCQERGISILAGGPYASGILASGAVEGARFDYVAAPPAVLDRVRRMEALCSSHGVPLQAAALQFPLGHPAVVSVVPGARTAQEVDANVAYQQVAIPEALWAELREQGLIDAEAASGEHYL